MVAPTTTKRRTEEPETATKPDLAWEVEPESVASEAWLLMQQLMFSEGKPRFVRIAFEHGLSPPQAWAIRRLAEPHSMGQLAQVLHCDQSNVTGITDRLEERGLVERTPSPGDRRVKLLVLTDKGRNLRAEMLRAVAVPPPALSDLPERDQRALRDLLRRAVEAAEPDSA
jgi:DNA-binding MarR family transcriptional regulator